VAGERGALHRTAAVRKQEPQEDSTVGSCHAAATKESNPMISVKKIATTAAFILALSGYALAQASLDARGTGGAVDSSKGAVNSAPSAVNRAPSAVNAAPSAVDAASSAVESSTSNDASSRSLNARSIGDDRANSQR
jgi:hypothetical protein